MAQGVAPAPGTDRPIAVIAGAGDLPRAIAELLRRKGRAVHVVAVEGEADRDYSDFPNTRLKMGAARQLKRALREWGCVEVTMAGAFRRPKFSEIEFDLGTMKLALSRVFGLKFGGDDAVMGGVVRIFEEEGFRIVGPRQIVPEIIAGKGQKGRLKPSRQAQDDIHAGVAAIARIGPLDIGQSLVIVDRRIVAVEAAEGTTAMIDRCAELRANGRIPAPPPSGVLVKMLKPGQETRVEMPVIGPDTLRAAARAGLSGIAVEAGGVVLVDHGELGALADELDLFLIGIPPADASKP